MPMILPAQECEISGLWQKDPIVGLLKVQQYRNILGHVAQSKTDFENSRPLSEMGRPLDLGDFTAGNPEI